MALSIAINKLPSINGFRKYCVTQTIQWSISHLFGHRWLNCSIKPTWTITSTASADKKGPVSNGNEELLHIP